VQEGRRARQARCQSSRPARKLMGMICGVPGGPEFWGRLPSHFWGEWGSGRDIGGRHMVCALRDRRPPQGPCGGSPVSEAMATKLRETFDAAIAADPYAVPPRRRLESWQFAPDARAGVRRPGMWASERKDNVRWPRTSFRSIRRAPARSAANRHRAPGRGSRPPKDAQAGPGLTDLPR
jgi:hypothetical protein